MGETVVSRLHFSPPMPEQMSKTKTNTNTNTNTNLNRTPQAKSRAIDRRRQHRVGLAPMGPNADTEMGTNLDTTNLTDWEVHPWVISVPRYNIHSGNIGAVTQGALDELWRAVEQHKDRFLKRSFWM
jgi:hypothetical protein